jgi:hypothetical protein
MILKLVQKTPGVKISYISLAFMVLVVGVAEMSCSKHVFSIKKVTKREIPVFRT